MSAPAPVRRRPAMDDRIRDRRLAVQRQAQRRRRRLGISVVLVVLLVAGAWAVSRSSLFAVSQVRVEGVAGERARQVRRVADLRAGGNVIGMDLEGAAGRVRKLPWVAAARVVPTPPALITIVVAERVPVVVANVAGGRWLIDAEGVVVGGGADRRLLRIDAPTAVMAPAGSPVSDGALRAALDVAAALPAEVRSATVRISVTDPADVRLHLKVGPLLGAQDRARLRDRFADHAVVEVRVGTATMLAAKLRVLPALLAAMPAGAVVDLRAPDHPVVVPAG